MNAPHNENQVVVAIPTGIFRNRYGVTGSFTIGVLLFFLPFLTIRCNDAKLASATGMQLAMGFEMEPGKEWKQLGGIFDNPAEKNTEYKDRDKKEKANPFNKSSVRNDSNQSVEVFGPNYLLITVITAGLLGILFSLLPFKKNWLCCLVVAWIGVTGFIISVFAILDKTKKYQVDAGFLKISVNFTFWFFLSVISYVAAIILSHRQWTERQALDREREISEFILSSGYPTAETANDEL